MTETELIGLVCSSQRPSQNMRIHFTREFFDRSLTSRMPSEVDEELLLPTVEYVVTLQGRGWMYLETMKYGAYKKYESERIIQKTFHLSAMIGFPRLRGMCYGRSFARMPNENDFWVEFFGYINLSRYRSYDLKDDRYRNILDRVFRVQNGATEGLYILESRERDGIKTWFTVDENKGFNVVRVQHFFPDGRINFESIHDIKQFPNGVWFQMGYDMIRYADPQTGREARFHRCVRVTNVEFDIEINKKTVELPEGVDAITRPTE